MKPRIFISAVTSEFGTSRQLVANVLSRLGYDPVWQDIFGTESGDLRQVLREKIDDCDGQIQLVGRGYGAEPPSVDEKFGRVSYTQFEFLYARARGKKTWLIFADEGCTRDRPLDELDLPCVRGDGLGARDEPDSANSHLAIQAERRALQIAWRQRWQQEGHIHHTATSDTELELKIERVNWPQRRGVLTRFKVGNYGCAVSIALLCLLVAPLIIRLTALSDNHVPYSHGPVAAVHATWDPNYGQVQRDFSQEQRALYASSTSSARLGELFLARRQAEDALRMFEECLKKRRVLAHALPSNVQVQADLSITYERIGQVFLTLDRAKDALQMFEDSLEIRRVLAESDPNDTQKQHDLSILFYRLGDVLLTLGRTDDALTQFQDGLKINRWLAESDPKDAEKQRDLINSHAKLGLVHRTAKDLAKSVAAYNAALQIARPLKQKGLLVGEIDGLIEELDADRKKSEQLRDSP